MITIRVRIISLLEMRGNRRIKLLDKFELLMIEQSLNEGNFFDHSRIRREISTPICLDESIHSIDDEERCLKWRQERS